MIFCWVTQTCSPFFVTHGKPGFPGRCRLMPPVTTPAEWLVETAIATPPACHLDLADLATIQLARPHELTKYFPGC